MQENIEIVSINRPNYKKFIFLTFLSFVILVVALLSIRAYSLTRNIIVNKSSSSSPLLAGKGNIWDEIDMSSIEEGNRRVNIVLLGIGDGNHPGEDLTDTIMVVSIDPKNNDVAMLSVPRDLYINVKEFGGNYKINSVYSLAKDKYDSKDQNKKYEVIKNTLADFLDVPIHYFVLINFEGFKEVVDIIGGVNIEVEDALYDPYYPDENLIGYDELFVPKGEQLMDGDLALKYARSRQTTSDFDRAKRQQKILVAVKNRVLEKENLLSIKRINQIMQVLSDNIKTDLQIDEISDLASIAKVVDENDIRHKVLDDSPEGMLYADLLNDMYVLLPANSSLREIRYFVAQFFRDPLIVSEKAKIKVTNGSLSAYNANLVFSELELFQYDLVDEIGLARKEDVVGSSTSKTYDKTFIYDYSNGRKKATLSFLKKYLNNPPVIVLDEDNRGFDIEIIVGDDYSSITK